MVVGSKKFDDEKDQALKVVIENQNKSTYETPHNNYKFYIRLGLDQNFFPCCL
jgi:hypothetical protein